MAENRIFAVIVVWWKDGVGKNSVLFAHVPEQIVFVWWKDGVGKNGVLFANVPEPLVFCMAERVLSVRNKNTVCERKDRRSVVTTLKYNFAKESVDN